MSAEFKLFFKTVMGNEGSLCQYPTRLDTYGCGCEHDCAYCYDKSLLAFRGFWDAKDPKVSSLEAIKKKIKRVEPDTILRLGGMTDCLQPAESRYGVTKATIDLLNEVGIGYLIVTKSHLIGTDEYLKCLDPKLAHIQITVTNTDDKKALTYERCSLSSKRLDAAVKLQAVGVDVPFVYCPLFPNSLISV